MSRPFTEGSILGLLVGAVLGFGAAYLTRELAYRHAQTTTRETIPESTGKESHENDLAEIRAHGDALVAKARDMKVRIAECATDLDACEHTSHELRMTAFFWEQEHAICREESKAR